MPGQPFPVHYVVSLLLLVVGLQLGLGANACQGSHLVPATKAVNIVEQVDMLGSGILGNGWVVPDCLLCGQHELFEPVLPELLIPSEGFKVAMAPQSPDEVFEPPEPHDVEDGEDVLLFGEGPEKILVQIIFR